MDTLVGLVLLLIGVLCILGRAPYAYFNAELGKQLYNIPRKDDLSDQVIVYKVAAVGFGVVCVGLGALVLTGVVG